MQVRDSLAKPHDGRVTAQPNQQRRPEPQPAVTTANTLVPSVEAANDKHRTEGGSYWPQVAEWGLVIGTVALAIYTARLFYATKRMADDARQTADKQAAHTEASIAVAERSADAACQAAAATETSVATMKATAERQLRAYVMIDSVEAAEKEPRQFPMPISYVVTIRNFGDTPAYDAEIIADAELAPATEENRLTNSLVRETKTSRMPIGPGGEIHLKVDPPKMVLAQLNELIAHARELYVYGVVHYRDAFGHNRTTRFRLRRAEDDHAMIACAEGNEAD
jgi:hypothetical protein